MKKIYIFLFLLLVNTVYSQTEQVSGVTVQLTSVSPVDQNIVWVCGYSGTVLRTTNGGTNWLNVSGGGIGATIQLVNAWGVSATEALVAGYLGTDTWVWRTTNAGVNWTQVFSQPGGFINGMVFKKNTPAHGIMQGDPVGGRWSLWKTTNSGANWDSTGMYLQQAGTEAGWNNSIIIASQQHYSFGDNIDSLLWFGTNNTKIYHSTNFGLSWTAQSTAPELNSYAIGMFRQFGFCDGLTGGANLMRTTNFGINWSTQSSVGTGNFSGFVLFPAPVDNLFAGYCWYTRNTTSIYRGTNGSGWALEYTAPAGNYRHFAVGRNTSYCWGVRSNGGITRAAYFVASISQTGNEIPASYYLGQNYPNPFNPVTKFKFQIPKWGVVKLTVYNTLGKEIQNLVNQSLTPGTYEADFDGSNYPSGVYYYRLEAGNFSETKKMVLIK